MNAASSAQLDAARQLARLPDDAPERCIFQPHRWSEWTLWVSHRSPVLEQVADQPPQLYQIEAHRDRHCRQCHATERQTYQGATSIIDDPHRIERKRK